MKVPANSTARWAMTAFFGMCAVFSVPTIVAPGKGGVALQVMSTAFSDLLVFLAYRSATAGLSIDAKNVTYRAHVRIIRWPTAVVQRFDVRDARVGALSWPRQVVWITLRDGRSTSWRS
jgi:hypothetical protein